MWYALGERHTHSVCPLLRTLMMRKNIMSKSDKAFNDDMKLINAMIRSISKLFPNKSAIDCMILLSALVKDLPRK